MTDVNYLKTFAASFNSEMWRMSFLREAAAVVQQKKTPTKTGLCVPEGQKASISSIKMVIIMVGFGVFLQVA